MKEQNLARNRTKGTKPLQKNSKLHDLWCELTITEKYCRMEGVGKEWYYFLPEERSRESFNQMNIAILEKSRIDG